MYIVGNIIYGVPMPWDMGKTREIFVLHATEAEIAAAWLNASGEAELPSHADLIESIKQGNVDDGVRDWLEAHGWAWAYHGGADSQPAWYGVRVGRIDETAHVRIADLPTPTDDQRAAVEAKYNALPEDVRAALPPLGLYIVWSSS